LWLMPIHPIGKLKAKGNLGSPYAVRGYDLDGFRCDYASGVPTDFWETLRPALERVRPGLALLAESEDPALLHGAFDVDYAWNLHHAMSAALAGRAPASSVRDAWQRDEARYPRGALRLRFSDNHDQLRATGQFGLPAALAASAVMFTLDGVPLLYNGMEVGDNTESTAPSLFERRPIAWEMAESRAQVGSYYRALIEFRRAHPVFTRGAVRWLRNSDEQRVLSYERSGAEALVVVVNLSSQGYVGLVDAEAGEYRDITPTGGTSPRRTSALPSVFLAPWEFRVFQRVRR